MFSVIVSAQIEKYMELVKSEGWGQNFDLHISSAIAPFVA